MSLTSDGEILRGKLWPGSVAELRFITLKSGAASREDEIFIQRVTVLSRYGGRVGFADIDYY